MKQDNGVDEMVSQDVTQFLLHGLKSELRPSPIHGIGTFAIRDIQKGEKIFPRWEGETQVYLMKPDQFEKFPIYVKRLIVKSFVNNPDEHDGNIWFRLYNNAYFDLSNPWKYVNTGESFGNIDSVTKHAIRDIYVNEEILGNYKLKDTQQYD